MSADARRPTRPAPPKMRAAARFAYVTSPRPLKETIASFALSATARNFSSPAIQTGSGRR